MKPQVLASVLRESVTGWIAARPSQMGASLAYYTVFSLAPLMLIATWLAGLIFGEDAAGGRIANEITGLVGPEIAEAVQDRLALATRDRAATSAPWISAAVLTFSSTALLSQLQFALNTVWGVADDSQRGWFAVVKSRALSFIVVLGVGAFLALSVVISTGVATVANYVDPAEVSAGTVIWRIVNEAVSLGLVTVLFAMVYKLLPDVELPWRDVWIGSAVTALLFSAGKQLMSLLLAHDLWRSSYGAAGSVVLILIFVYYASQIFLLGAGFTKAYSQRRAALARGHGAV